MGSNHLKLTGRILLLVIGVAYVRPVREAISRVISTVIGGY